METESLKVEHSFQPEIVSDDRAGQEEREELLGETDKANDEEEQAEQHFIDLNSNLERKEDYQDEILIDDDTLKQNLFFRGNKSNQNHRSKWWERENAHSWVKNTSFSELRLEKLASSSGQSIYLVHFVNFNGQENVLIELLVSTANILVNNKDWR